MSVTARKHRLGLYFEEQRQTVLAECNARVSHHELQAAQAEEERRLLQGQLWQQKLEFREAHQRSLTEMEELRKFQSSAFDTMARQKFIEDQNTILELSGRVQEFSKWSKLYERFWVFSGCWINSQWKFPRYQSTSVIHPSSNTWRDVETFFRSAVPQRRAAKHLGHTWHIGKRFCKSRCVILSTLSTRIASMEFIDRRAAAFVYSGEKWKARTRSRSEMPVWTVSQRFSHRRRLLKELWSRPTTTADFGSSFRQIPHSSHVCLLEDKIQDRGMYLFTIPYGCNGSKKWRWLIQWMI